MLTSLTERPTWGKRRVMAFKFWNRNFHPFWWIQVIKFFSQMSRFQWQVECDFPFTTRWRTESTVNRNWLVCKCREFRRHRILGRPRRCRWQPTGRTLTGASGDRRNRPDTRLFRREDIQHTSVNRIWLAESSGRWFACTWVVTTRAKTRDAVICWLVRRNTWHPNLPNEMNQLK